MKKRNRIGLGILLTLVTIAVLTVPEYRLTLFGYLRGENRFEGRPASYWRFKVDQYASPYASPTVFKRSYWDKILNFLSITNRHGRPEKPSVLSGMPEALPVLRDLIREKTNLPVTHKAYEALGTLGQQSAKDVLPLLEEEINGPDLHCRSWALRTLERFGDAGMPLLIRALRHESPDVRVAAAQTLQIYGPKGRDAVAALVEALEDEVEEVRTWPAHALMTIDRDEADRVHAEKFIDRDPGILGISAQPGNESNSP